MARKASSAFRLRAFRRDALGGTPRRIRRSGNIPAILYGHGVENVRLAVERRALEKLLPDLSSSTLMLLAVDGEGEPRRVLVNEVQRHPLSGAPVHVDFHQVRLTEKIRATVPLVFTGESPAVKDLGGTLVKSLDEMEVEALPQDLPEEIIVDVGRVKTFADHLRVRDLPVPEGVEVLDDAAEAVAVVVPPRTEEELEELDTDVEEKAGEIKTEADEERETAEEKESGAATGRERADAAEEAGRAGAKKE